MIYNKMFINLIKSLRPYHWVKNSFIFLPLFFAQRFGDLSALLNCVIAFGGFSLVASSIYVINDINDIELDRQHPRKCRRPIASGVISIKQGISLAVISFILGMAITVFGVCNIILTGVVLVYYLLNLAYTLRLKRYAIIDVMIIASGFVLRIMVGGIAAEVELSSWIILMTFLLAMFLGFAKRRDDVLISQKDGIIARANIVRYNVGFIDSVLVMTAGITIVAYIMYCMSPEVVERMRSDNLYISSIFVITGIIRYLQHTMVYETSGNPTKMLIRDRFLQLVILGWIATFIVIMYVDQL